MDEQILSYFNTLSTPEWLDYIFIFITRLGDMGFAWILCTVILLCFRNKRRSGFAMALALVFSAIAVNLALKNLAARPRPYDFYQGIALIIQPETSYSFPSGHTTSSFAAALTLFWLEKKIAPYAVILASLIAFSRLYLCVHYFTDVLGGMLLGALLAFAAVLVAKRVHRIGSFELG